MDMRLIKKKVIIIVPLLLFFTVIILLIPQTYEHPTLPVAACGSIDEIFFIGYRYDDKSGKLLASEIYVLDRDRQKISLYSDMTFTDSTRFINIAVDKDNNLFSIVRKQNETAIYEIWKINNGIVLDKYDITNSIDEENSGGILSFVVDGNGDIFIREIDSDEVIVIDKGGFETSRLKDAASNISFESMTTGKDGKVYALFCKNNDAGGGYKIISYADGLVNEIIDGNILPDEEIYSVMGTSTNYDLVMKGIEGVYGYDFNSEVAENIIYFPPYEAEFTKSFFIEDELCIFFTDVDDDKRNIIRTIELKSLDLVKGVFRQNYHHVY